MKTRPCLPLPITAFRLPESKPGKSNRKTNRGKERELAGLVRPHHFSDYVTRQLMTDYYAGLKHGQGRGEALRQVQLKMLRQKERQHPFYWASFIQSGEWANLDGRR
jgi:CHAT domain-containing protein